MECHDGWAVGAGVVRVIAAEVTIDSRDFGHLEPMITTALDEQRRAGVEQPPDIVLADAGYWVLRSGVACLPGANTPTCLT
jgi:hypothetical protein